MRLSVIATATLLVMAGPDPAVANPKPDCTSPSSTPEITYCTGLYLEAADAELNRAYQDVITSIRTASHLNAAQRRDWEQAMGEAQRHWIAFTAKDCGEVTGWEWHQGTGQGAASLACRLMKTQARTEELKTRYSH